MSFAVAKGELCSFSCNFLSLRVESRGEKRHISREYGHKTKKRKKGRQKFP